LAYFALSASICGHTKKCIPSVFVLRLTNKQPLNPFNTLNAELNPICHLLALFGAHHILHVSRIRVKGHFNHLNAQLNPICHLLALFGAHHILHVSRIRVKGLLTL
jgi:hypothetical protein